MIFESKAITLKAGRECVLRPVEADDAEAMVEHLRITSAESPFLLRNEDEVRFTVDKERQVLESFRESNAELMMAAVVNGSIAGICSINAQSSLRRMRHRCVFAISIKRDLRSLGLGRAMTEYALSLARDIGYEQIELEVVKGNKPAESLYKSLGFRVTGENPHALRYDDGSYADEWRMVREL